MLTADLVRVFRRKTELKLRAFDSKAKDRATTFAIDYVAVADAAVGATRADLLAALGAVEVPVRDQKLADGLRKLVLDRCEFEVPSEDPIAIRSDVFARAASWRREHRFDRDALLKEVAEERSISSGEEVERLLYADLKGAHRLVSFDAIDASGLVQQYEHGQLQAVLLKAESVEVEVRCKEPAAYRQLFRKLKFHRLLHTIEPLGAAKSGAAAGYKLSISGPFSLFSSVTKYGLQLAMIVPALRACDRWKLDAVVRWGKDRSRLTFHAEGKRDSPNAEAVLPPEVEKLREKFAKRRKDKKTKWKVEPATEIFSLPGVGVCVPDLVFKQGRKKVYLEVLGFWSRDAVWKRVELVEKGMKQNIIFAVPSKLRVSEEVLPDDLPGSLYVYKGTISIKAIEERLDR